MGGEARGMPVGDGHDPISAGLTHRLGRSVVSIRKEGGDKNRDERRQAKAKENDPESKAGETNAVDGFLWAHDSFQYGRCWAAGWGQIQGKVKVGLGNYLYGENKKNLMKL